MDTLKQFKDEHTYEYNVTKKFFISFPKTRPDGKNDYAPHEKSMKLIGLASHIASIFSWPALMLNTSALDIAEPNETEKIENKAQLEAALDKGYKASLSALEKASEADLHPNWSLTMKGQTLMEWTK